MDYKDIFTSILESRVSDRNEILKALDIVSDFIKRKGLMLYGGISIDYAVRLARDDIGIYNDTILPDYDFRSEMNYEDSCELAIELYEKGLINAQSINALHITTRRVRVNFLPVADITFIPKDVLNIIPTLTYNGFKVTHPNFMRCDLHSSLAFPYDNPPKEVILHRSKKDINRMFILDSLYPLETPTNILPNKDINISTKHILTGMAAYCYYMQKDITFIEHEDTLTYSSFYDQTSICIADGDYKVEGEYYEPFLEQRPPCCVTPELEILYYYGRIVSYNITPGGNKVVNIHLLMLYFMSRHFESLMNGYKADSDTCLYYYRNLFELSKNITDFPCNNAGYSLGYAQKMSIISYWKDIGNKVDVLDPRPPELYLNDDNLSFKKITYDSIFYKCSGKEVNAIEFDKYLNVYRKVKPISGGIIEPSTPDLFDDY